MKKSIIKLAETEIKNLKKYARKSELKRLNLSTINMQLPRSCIYGQMTGICYSPRALDLIKKCCKRVVEGFSEPRINGAPHGENREMMSWWSPLEVWGAKASEEELSEVISYLRDERKTIELK